MITFKLDTGADVNVLPLRYLKFIEDVYLQKGGTPPQSYSGSDFKYVGTCECVVMCRNEITTLKFVVIDTQYEALLGLTACSKLNLIKRVYSISQTEKDEFVAKNIDLFEGLGCFVRNLDIKLKKGSIPIVKPARRIPLSLSTRVKEELQRMVERDIIEPVDGPVERASNMVIVEKKNGQLRICIDPQDVNSDILQENYTIPSFESISAQLAGKKFFTVLDLKEGFWQIALSRAASEICTFNTTFGCYRLPYGIKISPEVFQKYNERNFANIPNVTVFIDDILIAADTEDQHDELLQQVVNRARKMNIKFNKDKIQYKVKEVRYLGKIISCEGVKCDPDRIKAILKISQPKDKKDLQKLLGMVNYIREYITNLAEKLNG